MIHVVVMEDNGAHVRVAMFVGPTPGHRALAGTLTFRSDEWQHLIEPSWRSLGWLA